MSSESRLLDALEDAEQGIALVRAYRRIQVTALTALVGLDVFFGLVFFWADEPGHGRLGAGIACVILTIAAFVGGIPTSVGIAEQRHKANQKLRQARRAHRDHIMQEARHA